MKMATVWRAAKRLLIHGGSARVRPYEKACLDAWRTLLTAEGLSLLDQQLERLSFLQRQANDKLLCFYDVNDEAAKHWPDSHWTNNQNASSQDKGVASSRGRPEYIVTKDGITRVNPDGTTDGFNRDGTAKGCKCP